MLDKDLRLCLCWAHPGLGGARKIVQNTAKMTEFRTMVLQFLIGK